MAGVAAYLYIVVPAQKEEKQAMVRTRRWRLCGRLCMVHTTALTPQSDLLPKPIATLQHLHKLKNQHLSIKAEVQGMQLQIRREHARRRALEKGDLEFERRTGGHLHKE